MVEIPTELKERLKAERLREYSLRIFSVQMDIEAYKAVGDEVHLDKSMKALESLRAAYQAVEVM